MQSILLDNHLRSSPLYMPPNTTIQITDATTTHVPRTSFRVIFVFTSNFANIKLNINATLPNGATHFFFFFFFYIGDDEKRERMIN